jgi:hypothetical protein
MTLRDPPACVGLFPHAASCSRGVLLDFTGASFSADVLGLHRRVRPTAAPWDQWPDFSNVLGDPWPQQRLSL